MHQSQPLLRWLPNGMQRVVEEITAPLPVAQLLWESTPEDLRQAMDASAVDRAVVVAHPPLLTNEQAWDLTQAEPSRWIPAIFVSAQDPNATAELERWNQKGVRLLKLNPALDGVEPD